MPGAINILVSHPAKLIAVGMPKCGSSTLVETFLRMSGFDVPPRKERSVARTARESGDLQRAGLEFLDCYPEDISKTVLANPGYRVFTVSRDPYERIWSAYFNKLNRYTKSHRYGYYLLGKAIQLLGGPKAWSRAEVGNRFLHRFVSFPVFLDELERLGIDMDPHFDSQFHLMDAAHVHYDRVLPMESLSDALLPLLHEFEVPADMLNRLSSVPRANKRLAQVGPRPWDDPAIKAQIERLYAADMGFRN